MRTSNSSHLLIAAILLMLVVSLGLHADDSCKPHWDNSIGDPGMNLFVHSLELFDDGNGPSLFAGGYFTVAGGVQVNHIAKWDGAGWSALSSGMSGDGLPSVYAITVFDDGSGPALYAGGEFTTAGGVTVNNVARWTGKNWEALSGGVNDRVNDLVVFDDGAGPALYAGGWFTQAGGAPANRVAKWDGASWSPLGSGVDGIGTVECMTALDATSSGLGAGLFVGGEFSSAGGVPASRIAMWDGAKWSALGSGVDDSVLALTVFDSGNGAGPQLVTGGYFSTAGGAVVNRIAQWNGTSWSALNGGASGDFSFVSALTTFDDSSGVPMLLVGGNFSSIGGVAANRIAVWDGGAWSALGSGTNSTVRAVAALPNDPQNENVASIYVGGIFSEAGGHPSQRISQWRACAERVECLPCDFNCDGVVGVPDLLYLLANWGPCPGCDVVPCSGCGDCPADLTGDCIVGVADLLVLLAKWG